ncbi:hypothetical protein ACOSQ3_004196 [Xanthoceras sorbifolium]
MADCDCDCNKSVSIGCCCFSYKRSQTRLRSHLKIQSIISGDIRIRVLMQTTAHQHLSQRRNMKKRRNFWEVKKRMKQRQLRLISSRKSYEWLSVTPTAIGLFPLDVAASLINMILVDAFVVAVVIYLQQQERVQSQR